MLYTQRLKTMRTSILGLAVAALLVSCGTNAEPTLVAGDDTANADVAQLTTTTSPLDDLPVTTLPPIDADAILAASGFQRCPASGYALEGDITAERGQELIYSAVETGIGQGGSPGGEGQLTRLDLFVLDEASLATLATFAEPDELCVEGADPNDFVPLGPQQLSGPGWRWVGAGSTMDAGVAGSGVRLIDNQADYDQLWPLLGEGPETEQITVDFDTEVILTYHHGSGVNFGACGVRFDGYGRHADGLVVLDFLWPGGNVICDAAMRPATYAVALERRFVGEIPFDAAIRDLPRNFHPIALTVGTPVIETPPIDLEASPVEPVPTTEPPVLPTAPPVVGDFAAGEIVAPAYVSRAGSTEPGAVDLPVPDGWEASPDMLAVNVTGRGGLQVVTFDADDPAWRTIAGPDQLEIVEGPTALAVPLYVATPDGVVTTGESASVQQYRHGSDDSNEWLRRVVWVYDQGDRVTVAVLGFPEFPDGSSFDTDDPIQTSLAGQDPLAIMNDIRFFSIN